MKILALLIIISLNLFASYEALLFNGNCITCHKINESISAPSIKLVQKSYKQAFTDKKEFVEYMSTWVLKPNHEMSLMESSILKYGLMPELGYQKEVLEDIARYLYETKFQ